MTDRRGRAGRPNAPARFIVDDHGDVELYKRCTSPECLRWLTLERYGTRGARWDFRCRDCRNQANRERRATMTPEQRREINQRRWERTKADPQRLARRRDNNRRAQSKRNRVNPQGKRAAERRWRAKVKADPERYEAYLARDRMNRRLRAEREGRPIGPARPATGGYRGSIGGRNDEHLDPRPLQEWLEAMLAVEVRDNGDMRRLCRELGWNDRQLRNVRSGLYETVTLHTADRLLTNYGRPVVIRSRDLERRLTAWAQGLPGNGTRLLAYLDRAEAVAHLADLAVMSLSDLWPELAEA